MRRILYNLLKANSKHWKIHVFCWAIFIAYEVGSVYIISDQSINFWSYLFYYTLYISLFYIHSLYILPSIFEGKGVKWWRISFIFLELGIFILLATLVSFFIEEVLLIRGKMEQVFDVQFFAMTAFRNIYFILYSTGYYFLLRLMRSKREEFQREVQVEQLRSRLLQAEVDYLRARINPHLLFNSLSFIKSAIKHSPRNADEAIMLLSKILDFSLQDTSQHEVFLMDEVKQVENLIRLNELRIDKPLAIRLTKNIDESNVSVIPIVLLTLVENVFKHGHLHRHEQAAEIYIEASPGQVIYRTSNLVKDSQVMYSHYSGLQNIRLRLERAFPDGHRFTHGMVGDRFCAEVLIFTPIS